MPQHGDTTGIDVPWLIIATASAPRSECIPHTSSGGNVMPALAACRDSRVAIDDAHPNASNG